MFQNMRQKICDEMAAKIIARFGWVEDITVEILVPCDECDVDRSSQHRCDKEIGINVDVKHSYPVGVDPDDFIKDAIKRDTATDLNVVFQFDFERVDPGSLRYAAS